jgi:thiol:disulfide interchange protein
MIQTIAAFAAMMSMASCAGQTESVGRPFARVTPLVERQETAAGNTARVAIRVSLPEDIHTQSNKPRDRFLIPTTLTIDAPAGFSVDEIVWPPASDFVQSAQDQPLSVFEHEFVVGVSLTVAAGTSPGDVKIPARLRYQACNRELCYPPTTASFEWPAKVVAAANANAREHADVFDRIPFGKGEKPGAASEATGSKGAAPNDPPAPEEPLQQLGGFKTLASTGGYLGSGAFVSFIRNAENGIVEKGMFDDRGPMAILLIVLIGGLALNLTPCVLPMIPINLAIIGAGAKASSRSRGFLLGAAYGGAMALVYGALGLVVILTAGTFGQINASPWFNAGIAALFIVLGLAMFDVLLIDFSVYSSWFKAGNEARGTFLLAFSMGAVAALLAGACVAPVVIQVVLFASNLYAAGTVIALALPFLLGLGMAIPWPIAGAGLASLPKPGPWMNRVKYGFGILILATAAYYGYIAYDLFSSRWVDPKEVASGVEEKVKEGWTPSLAEGLAAAKREGKPVLIDMWATWCKNCLTMDKTTLKDSNVVDALKGYVKIKFQVEDPDDPALKPILDRFSVIGLPTYLVLRPEP